ncbi:MAG: FkbM family methyltransferase [Verrucomicrobia bacterium]|nr:FkbM family methyltransferase [Verrucomicrobiota bacterium]
MKIAWFSPYGPNSAIAKFSSLVVDALAARDHSITLVSSDSHQLGEYRRPPPTVQLLHWSVFGSDRDPASGYDLFVYNIGDHFANHAGVLSFVDRYPGVCIFHDFYIVNLFLGWCSSTCNRTAAHSIVTSLYGEKVAKEFWDRGADVDFQDWCVSHAPMTGWLARKALAAVAHAPFYELRLAEWCAGPVDVIPLAYAAPEDASHIQVQGQNGCVRILTVGRANSNKRVESIVQTIASSAVLRTRCEYDVVGEIDAMERTRLLLLIDQLGLHGLVHLHGPVSDFELRWRFAEAAIVCCLRWPALEGASASCIEAMSYGKAVIVTDTGFYGSIPSDRVMKVRGTHEIEDLTRHLEMLVVNRGEREIFGKRAREWALFEYAPEVYASRIEPLLEAALVEKPAINALMQIGANLRAMSAKPDEPIVQQVSSDFRSLFFGSESRVDTFKWISNMLLEQASQTQPDGNVSQPPSQDFPGEPALSPSLGVKRFVNGFLPVPGDAPSLMKFRSDSERSPGGLLPGSAATPDKASFSRFVGRCTESIRTLLKRYSLRHFIFLCAEPILSHLRSYLSGDLLYLTQSGLQRLVEIEQSVETLRQLTDEIQKRTERLAFVEGSVGALREQANEIQKRTSRLAFLVNNVGVLRQQADEIQKRTEKLAFLEDTAVRLTRFQPQLANACRFVDLLVNRNVLVLRNELLARTPHGYLLAPIDDPALAALLMEGVLWEPEISALLDLILKAGMTFVDVGAHIGLHTLHGARVVGLSGAVIAFEPTPTVFRLLQRSVNLNGIGAICRCLNLALSVSEGMAVFHVSAVCGENSLYRLGDEKEKSELQVRTASLDSVLQEAQRIDVVKIDVEGAELDVLEGMKHILAKHRDILLIVEYGVVHLKRLGTKPVDWFSRFFAHGLTLFAFDKQADTWREIAEEKASELPSGNVVFVRLGTSQWSILKQHEL